jgi:hypothetical protein
MFFIIGGNGSHAGATAIYKFVSLLMSYMVQFSFQMFPKLLLVIILCP